MEADKKQKSFVEKWSLYFIFLILFLFLFTLPSFIRNMDSYFYSFLVRFHSLSFLFPVFFFGLSVT